MVSKMRLVWLLPLVALCGCTSIGPNDLHVLDRNRSYTQTDVVGLLYKAPGFRIDKNANALVLHPVKVNMNSIVKPGDAQGRPLKALSMEFAENLDVELAAAIRKKTQLTLVRPGEQVDRGLKTATLTVIVTELDPGNGFARWFIGAGAGATKVQVEGELKDSNNSLLMAFADRRMHSGNPTLGLNVAAMSNEYTLAELRKEIVDAVVKLLRS